MFAAKNIIGIIGINGKYFFQQDEENENFLKSSICPFFIWVQIRLRGSWKNFLWLLQEWPFYLNDHKIEYSPIERRLQNSISSLPDFPDFYSKLSKTEGRSLKSTLREVPLICLPDYFAVKTLTMVVFRSCFIEKQSNFL